MKLCGLILAAGGSSRLGRPKQLVVFKGKTLLEHSIESALETSLHEVFVVLGAHFYKVHPAIGHLPVTIIKHEQWQEGIGSSISKGMQSISNAGNYDAVLIMLCDQLHINTHHLQLLIDSYRLQKGLLIATTYSKQTAVPAVFDRQFFPELSRLSGDRGAKKMIDQQAQSLFAINFEQAGIDIDTPEDLLRTGLY